jgi:hypothetical protein
MPTRKHDDDDDLLSPRGGRRLRDELAADDDGPDTAWPKATGIDATEGQKDFGMGKITGIIAEDDWEPHVDLSDLGVEPLALELENSMVQSVIVQGEPDADLDGDLDDQFDDIG